MKEYTSRGQTQLLRKLGYAEPKSISDFTEIVDHQGTTFTFDYDYSIGELVAFIETARPNAPVRIWRDSTTWYVKLEDYVFQNVELIEALYDCCVDIEKGQLQNLED